jgi:hypothetical protein
MSASLKQNCHTTNDNTCRDTGQEIAKINDEFKHYGLYYVIIILYNPFLVKTDQRNGGNNRDSSRGGDGGSKLLPFPSAPLNYRRLRHGGRRARSIPHNIPGRSRIPLRGRPFFILFLSSYPLVEAFLYRRIPLRVKFLNLGGGEKIERS